VESSFWDGRGKRRWRIPMFVRPPRRPPRIMDERVSPSRSLVWYWWGSFWMKGSAPASVAACVIFVSLCSWMFPVPMFSETRNGVNFPVVKLGW
jgi:hypothetical protein